MATNEIRIGARPSSVFAVLADPDSYEHWVVGAARVRSVDGHWPEPGATFHHRQLVPGIGLADTTTVISCERPPRLELEVRARPLFVGHVELQLRDDRGATHVTMIERVVNGLLGLAPRVLIDPGVHARNAESLRRPRRLAERHG